MTPHLVRRFFAVLSARRLRPEEQAAVAELLNRGEEKLFWSQQAADQRHAWRAASYVLQQRPGDRLLARAALLHDVGKAVSRLGAVRRSLATIGAALRMPLPRRWRDYVDHAGLGAAALAAAGAEEAVVAYTRHHHESRPPTFAAAAWEVLSRADRK